MVCVIDFAKIYSKASGVLSRFGAEDCYPEVTIRNNGDIATLHLRMKLTKVRTTEEYTNVDTMNLVRALMVPSSIHVVNEDTTFEILSGPDKGLYKYDSVIRGPIQKVTIDSIEEIR